MQKAPHINQDMTYSEAGIEKEIRVYHRMNARLDLEDLFAKLRINFPEKDS